MSTRDAATSHSPPRTQLVSHPDASQWSPEHDYATRTHARDLLEVIGVLELSGVTMVGCSWGALVSLAFAAANPSHVKRLVLVDTEPSARVEQRGDRRRRG